MRLQTVVLRKETEWEENSLEEHLSLQKRGIGVHWNITEPYTEPGPSFQQREG